MESSIPTVENYNNSGEINMPLIPLTCPSCGANLTVDSSKDAAICEFCGKPYIVKDAVVNNYINMNIHHATIQTDAINLTAQNEFEIKAGELVQYVGEKQDVLIPGNVTVIGDSAFKGLNIKSVTIPDGVTRIGRDAFRGCIQLKNILIPKTVTEIAAWAFAGAGLVSIVVPESVKTIGAEAFAFCSELKDVTVSQSTKLSPGAFGSTPYWSGRCPRCGGVLKDAPFYERLRGYSKICNKCDLVFK